MPLNQETTAAALPVRNVPVSFGFLATPNGADYLDVYVDSRNAANVSRIQWFIEATAGTVVDVIETSLPVPSNTGPYLPFDPIELIEGTRYELFGVAVDAPVPLPIVAGFCTSDQQVNSTPLDVVSGSAILPAFGGAVVFATIPRYHTQFQAQVDNNGATSTASTWLLQGSITGAGGTITATIATGAFADTSVGSSQVYIVFNTAQPPNKTPAPSVSNKTLRARGASSYQLVGVSQDVTVGSVTAVNASLIGFDLNLDILAGSSATLHTQLITASGPFVVPAGVSNLICLGMGGGGGGGGGEGGIVGADANVSGGGGGASGQIAERMVAGVVPAAVLAVIIGVGGVGGLGGVVGGDGGLATNGGRTTLATPGGTFTWFGGSGGFPGTAARVGNPGAPSLDASGNAITLPDAMLTPISFASPIPGSGGRGGDHAGTGGGVAAGPGIAGANMASAAVDPPATPGAGGAAGGAGADDGCGGGGGGAGLLGGGGNGGAGATAPGAGIAGSSALANSGGGGGGGGGGSSNVGAAAGGVGGNGGSGFLLIGWVN